MLSLLQKVLPRSARRSAGHAGVVLGEDSFALVVVRRDDGGKPSIDHCRVHSAHGAVGARLRAVLDKLGARRAATCAVVDADDYQVVQVEAPDVLPSEMRAAVRWRLRDAISFEVDEAAVDVFEIPDPARRTQTRMLFAVAARDAAIERSDQHAATRRERLLRDRHSRAVPAQPQRAAAAGRQGRRDAGAQRELRAAGHDAPGSDVPHSSHRHRASFRAARAGARRSALDAGALALELQRSLDYYESHYDQTPIGDLVIAPGGERAQRVAAALRNETSLRVSVLDVREFCNVYKSGELVTDWPSLMALGAALRTESAE